MPVPRDRVCVQSEAPASRLLVPAVRLDRGRLPALLKQTAARARIPAMARIRAGGLEVPAGALARDSPRRRGPPVLRRGLSAGGLSVWNHFQCSCPVESEFIRAGTRSCGPGPPVY